MTCSTNKIYTLKRQTTFDSLRITCRSYDITNKIIRMDFADAETGTKVISLTSADNSGSYILKDGLYSFIPIISAADTELFELKLYKFDIAFIESDNIIRLPTFAIRALPFVTDVL